MPRQTALLSLIALLTLLVACGSPSFGTTPTGVAIATQPATPASPPTAAPSPAATATPAPSPASTPSPVPTSVPTPTAQPTVAPSPTPRPSPTPLPATPTPVPTATTAEWRALQASLQSLVNSWDGQNAVSVTDLQTGQTISVNGSRPQLAACTIKIPIIMIVAQDIEAGRYTAASVDSLVRSAMGPSETWPARELLRIAGGDDIGVGIRRVNALMQQLGMTDSLLAHPPGYYWEDYGYGDAENLLTTNDLNLLLGKLYSGQALSPSATKYVLWSMTIAPDWVDASLGGPLPSGVKLYHKFGQLYAPENTWNDAGVVVFQRDGQAYAYAIAYLGSYGDDWRVAYDHASAVSARAWRYFNATY